MSEGPEGFKDRIKKAEQMVKKGETETILIPLGAPVTLGGVPFSVSKVKGKHVTLVVGVGYSIDYDNPRTRKKYNYKQTE